MEDAYKRVDMIELHDAGVIVTPQHYSDGITGWTEWPAEDTEFWQLSGEVLGKLARHLGLETLPIYKEWQFKGEKKLVREELGDWDIRVRHSIPHSGTGYHVTEGNEAQKIDWLEVKTPCQPGFLTIRACLAWDTSDGEKETRVRELAYSGSYTVWWADDDDE